MLQEMAAAYIIPFFLSKLFNINYLIKFIYNKNSLFGNKISDIISDFVTKPFYS